MAYEKQLWNDRQVEKPLTFTMTNNDDGTVTLTPAPGKVTNEGDPMSAERLNHMEDGIAQVNDIPEIITNKETKTYKSEDGVITAIFRQYGKVIDVQMLVTLYKGKNMVSCIGKELEVPDWAKMEYKEDNNLFGGCYYIPSMYVSNEGLLKKREMRFYIMVYQTGTTSILGYASSDDTDEELNFHDGFQYMLD